MKFILQLLALALFAVNAHAANPQVEIKTNMGVIVLELYPDKAPKTVENFLQYVKDDQFKGTIFHRVIPGFMIQGGGFTVDFAQKNTRAPIQNEANNGLRNEVGTIAMARTSDPHSATAQFFINVSDNQSLNFAPGNPGYAVFGRVNKGMDVVNKIVSVPTGTRGPFANVPNQSIVIEDVRILPADKPAAK